MGKLFINHIYNDSLLPKITVMHCNVNMKEALVVIYTALQKPSFDRTLTVQKQTFMYVMQILVIVAVLCFN